RGVRQRGLHLAGVGPRNRRAPARAWGARWVRACGGAGGAGRAADRGGRRRRQDRTGGGPGRGRGAGRGAGEGRRVRREGCGREEAVAGGPMGDRPIAVAGGDDKTVRVWDLEKAGALGEPLVGHEGWVNTVAAGTIGDRPIAVSGGGDKTVRVWDLSAGGPLG